MYEEKKYLVILPCSKKKKKLNDVRALDLYDGPFYQIIRKYPSENLDVLIISAKYGLIDSCDIISYYDQSMTPERAQELSHQIQSQLLEIIIKRHYDEIFINLGYIYSITLNNATDNIFYNYNVLWASGQIGERLHQLKQWVQNISGGKEAVDALVND